MANSKVFFLCLQEFRGQPRQDEDSPEAMLTFLLSSTHPDPGFLPHQEERGVPSLGKSNAMSLIYKGMDRGSQIPTSSCLVVPRLKSKMAWASWDPHTLSHASSPAVPPHLQFSQQASSTVSR